MLDESITDQIAEYFEKLLSWDQIPLPIQKSLKNLSYPQSAIPSHGDE